MVKRLIEAQESRIRAPSGLPSEFTLGLRRDRVLDKEEEMRRDFQRRRLKSQLRTIRGCGVIGSTENF